MTDRVHPSGTRPSDPKLTAATGYYGSGSFVVPDTDDLYASYDGLLGAPLNAFAFKSSSGMDVVIDTGESFIEGGYVARDVETTVTLDAQVSNQMVYLGYDPDATNKVVIGKDSDFQARWPRISIWEFDTDGSSVTSSVGERHVGRRVDVKNTRYEGPDSQPVDFAQVSGISNTSRNSQQLGGKDPSAYAVRNQDENITGSWNFQSYIRANDIRLYSGGIGVRWNTDPHNDISYFVPYENMDNKYKRAIEYDFNIDQWNLSGSPRAGGSRILTQEDESGLSVEYADQAGNAELLDNKDRSDYALLAQNETVNGQWDFNEPINLGEIRLYQGGLGWRINTDPVNAISYIAPRQSGNIAYSADLEFDWAVGDWSFGTDLRVGGKLTVNSDVIGSRFFPSDLFVFPRSSSRPGSPRPGAVVYRTDKD